MGDVVQFKESMPRIRIIFPPISGNAFPDWLLKELVGITVPVEKFVPGGRHWNGEKIDYFEVSTGKLISALSRKSKSAAKFVKGIPKLGGYLLVNADACCFLGSWSELVRKSAQT